MATRLNRTVRRSIAAPRRDLIVSIIPAEAGALIEIREKGRRRGFSIHVAALHYILADRAALAEIAERKRARKAKRAAR